MLTGNDYIERCEENDLYSNDTNDNLKVFLLSFVIDFEVMYDIIFRKLYQVRLTVTVKNMAISSVMYLQRVDLHLYKMLRTAEMAILNCCLEPVRFSARTLFRYFIRSEWFLLLLYAFFQEVIHEHGLYDAYIVLETWRLQQLQLQSESSA